MVHNFKIASDRGAFMRICDLKQKEVINVCTCGCIGCVSDVDIDPRTGRG